MAVYFAASTPVERFESKLKKYKPTPIVNTSSTMSGLNNEQASMNMMPVNTATATMQSGGQVNSVFGPQAQQGILNEIGQIGQIEDMKMSNQVDLANYQHQAEMRRRALQNSVARAQSVGASGQGVNPFFGTAKTGLGFGGNLKGLGLDASQMNNARVIMNVGKQRGLSAGDITIGIMTALAESGLRNVRYGDRDSQGLFQQRPSQGWGSVSQITNPIYSAGKFFDTLKTTGGPNPWQRAQNVQRSAFSDGSNYRAQYDLAKRIVTAASTPGSTATKTAAAGWINQNQFKYHDFDGWYGAQCVDLFNYYNRGFVGGNFIGGVTGATDIWGNPGMNKNYVAVGRNQRAQMGDVVVYGRSWGGGYGHIGIVVEDRGGQLRVLNANANGKANSVSVISTFGKNDLLGYYRPKRLMR